MLLGVQHHHGVGLVHTPRVIAPFKHHAPIHLEMHVQRKSDSKVHEQIFAARLDAGNLAADQAFGAGSAAHEL